MTSVLYALLFLPALVAIAYVLRPRPKLVEEAVVAPEPATISGDVDDPFATLDHLLAELERTARELELAAR